MTRDRSPKNRPRLGEAAPPIAPEAAAALEAEVAALTTALAAGEAPPDLRRLVTARPKDPAWDLRLMARLAALNHPAIPPLLAALFGAAPDKARRKALKRALHLLKTRGMPVPADLLPREAAAPLGQPAVPPQAFVSPIFGDGQRYLILEAPREVLGGNFLLARISDQDGFQECTLLNLKSKDRREVWERLRSQELDFALAPVPDVVRLLEEAYALDPDAPEGGALYASLRGRIKERWGAPAPETPVPGELKPLSPEERRHFREKAPELAADPLFQSWLPGMEELTPWLEKLKELEGSPLVLSEIQQRARLDAVVDEATAALYPKEARATWGRRLLAMAYFLDLKGRLPEAHAAQAAGEDLLSGEQSPLLGENYFLRALVWRALNLAREFIRQGKAPKEAPDLLAKPTSPLIVTR
jgi:hypothetical protein